jgi:pimeloyl-ACP methyl ester carboxylesterase
MRWYANVREVGGGDATVVLAHGYGSNQALWDKLVPALSRRNRVILFDWGFTGGGAEHQEEAEEGRYTFGKFADDLIALLDDKGVRGAVLVGHSMSAMAACIASVRRPDLVTHLVLLCASPRSAKLATYISRLDHVRMRVHASCASTTSLHHALPLAVATNLLRRRPTATAQSFYF